VTASQPPCWFMHNWAECCTPVCPAAFGPAWLASGAPGGVGETFWGIPWCVFCARGVGGNHMPPACRHVIPAGVSVGVWGALWAVLGVLWGSLPGSLGLPAVALGLSPGALGGALGPSVAFVSTPGFLCNTRLG
jgi:hypothetical protein